MDDRVNTKIKKLTYAYVVLQSIMRWTCTNERLLSHRIGQCQTQILATPVIRKTLIAASRLGRVEHGQIRGALGQPINFVRNAAVLVDFINVSCDALAEVHGVLEQRQAQRMQAFVYYRLFGVAVEVRGHDAAGVYFHPIQPFVLVVQR